jgi:hypothetical protein
MKKAATSWIECYAFFHSLDFCEYRNFLSVWRVSSRGLRTLWMLEDWLSMGGTIIVIINANLAKCGLVAAQRFVSGFRAYPIFD